MAYAKRYCEATRTRFGWDVSGAANLDELERELRSSGWMIRRLKRDVLAELPAKTRQVLPLDLPGAKRLVKEEWQAKKALEGIDAQLERELDEERRHALLGSRGVALASLAAARKAVALAKIGDVAEQVAELRASGEPVLVWAFHHEVTDALVAALPGAVRCDGRDSSDHRAEMVTRFQRGEVEILVLGITAMGTGHTLTRAATALFVEMDWVPGNLLQAEDRIHRIGQHRPVLLRYIVLPGSIDEKLAATLDRKASIISQALDGEVVTIFAAA
jgi:SWI/SNF-related matrix-associated actin-dependent regulator 1 of chromatin subfamily A